MVFIELFLGVLKNHEVISDEDFERRLELIVVHRIQDQADLLYCGNRRTKNTKLSRCILKTPGRVAHDVEVALQDVNLLTDLGQFCRVQ